MNSSKKKPEEFSKMLLPLRYASINPANPKAQQETLKQHLTASEVLFMNETGVQLGKRKYDQLLQERSVSPFGLAPKEPTERNCTEFDEGQGFVALSVSEVTSGPVSGGKSNQIFPNQGGLHESTKPGSNVSRESVPKTFSFQDDLWDWSAGKDVVLIQDSDDESTGKQSSHHGDVQDCSIIPGKDVIHIQDSDDDSTGTLFFCHKDVKDCSDAPGNDVVLIQDSDDDSSGGSNKWNSAEPVTQTFDGSFGVLELGNNLPIKHMSGKKVSAIFTLDGSVDNAKFLSPTRSPRRSMRFINFIGDHLQRQAIPVGNRFQADIPVWTGTHSFDYNLDSSKWLGEKIWPSDSRNMEIGADIVGKGRPERLCSCDIPGTTECIQAHILEKSQRLLSEIGDAFYRWGFDTMGEAVSKSWTLKEQNNFKKLFRTRTSSKKKSFWRRVFKCLTSKRRESILSYYYNVFVLRNVRRQMQLLSRVIDSDNDVAGEGYNRRSPVHLKCRNKI